MTEKEIKNYKKRSDEAWGQAAYSIKMLDRITWITATLGLYFSLEAGIAFTALVFCAGLISNIISHIVAYHLNKSGCLMYHLISLDQDTLEVDRKIKKEELRIEKLNAHVSMFNTISWLSIIFGLILFLTNK